MFCSEWYKINFHLLQIISIINMPIHKIHLPYINQLILTIKIVFITHKLYPSCPEKINEYKYQIYYINITIIILNLI